MRGKLRKLSTVLLSGLLIFFSAVSWAQDYSPVQEVGAVKRVAPETATQGINVDEYLERQASLHSWLAVETPAGALADPIAIELSQKELDEINNVDLDQPGPLRVGVVKELDSPVTLSCRLGSRAVGSRRGEATCGGGGVLQMTADGGFVWARSVKSSGAVGIRVHVTDLSLPDDADLYFYSLEGEAYGPFQARGPNDDGDFWLPSVMSDTGIIVVRHFGPDGAKELPLLSMTFSEVAHIGDGFIDDPIEGSSFCPFNASCVENATCQNTGPAAAAELAAAKMLWVAGCCINVCTGGLIADTDSGSEIPYFLTANHCLSNSNAASNLEAFFQYQVSCGGSCPAGTFDPAPPSFPKTVGATVEATGKKGDFTLLRLSQSPPAGSVFLGWNNAPIAFTSGADLHRIHHPEGAPQSYSEHAVDTNIGTCLQTPRGQFIYSDDVFGATEDGSSGAPVVNSAGEIVGQLAGCCPVGGGNCFDVCDVDNHTIDGAFAFYFSNVEEFLDPAGCTPTTADCTDGVDNDCDNLTDCDDTNGGAEDCTNEPTCQSSCANPGGLPPGSSCTSDSECCSDKCKGPPNRKTCR